MSYPPSAHNTPDKTNDKPQVTDHPKHHNDLRDGINAIVAELGTNPSGAYPTVTDRLAALTGEALDSPTSVPYRAYVVIGIAAVDGTATTFDVLIRYTGAPGGTSISDSDPHPDTPAGFFHVATIPVASIPDAGLTAAPVLVMNDGIAGLYILTVSGAFTQVDLLGGDIINVKQGWAGFGSTWVQAYNTAGLGGGIDFSAPATGFVSFTIDAGDVFVDGGKVAGYAAPTEVQTILNDLAGSIGGTPFPGFGTDHSHAAYGDHNHDGTYSPVGHNHDGTYAPIADAFPGFGTDHSHAAYGDHNHGVAYVSVASPSNIDITSTPAVIDGLALADITSLWLFNQSESTENGPYTPGALGDPLVPITDPAILAAYTVVAAWGVHGGIWHRTVAGTWVQGQSYADVHSARGTFTTDGSGFFRVDCGQLGIDATQGATITVWAGNVQVPVASGGLTVTRGANFFDIAGLTPSTTYEAVVTGPVNATLITLT